MESHLQELMPHTIQHIIRILVYLQCWYEIDGDVVYKSVFLEKFTQLIIIRYVNHMDDLIKCYRADNRFLPCDDLCTEPKGR